MNRHTTTALCLAGLWWVSGCQSNPREEEPGETFESGASDSVATREGKGHDPIVALVDGKALRASELMGPLFEMAGGEVLYEYLLDRRLERELESKGLLVTDAEVEAEREILLAQFSDDPDRSRQILREIGERRGLGPRRMKGMLWRTAALRVMIRDQVVVSESMVAQAYEDRGAEQSVCRMILVPTLREAQEVVTQLEGGASFIELAEKWSTDSSRVQGGLLPPIAPWDVSFPRSITAVASGLAVGARSDPIVMDNGYAILLCEKKIRPTVGTMEEEEGAIRTELRLGLERAEMDRLARTLVEVVEVQVLDADLNRAFERRRESIRESAAPAGDR